MKQLLKQHGFSSRGNTLQNKTVSASTGFPNQHTCIVIRTSAPFIHTHIIYINMYVHTGTLKQVRHFWACCAGCAVALTWIHHVPLTPAEDEQIAGWMEPFYSASPWGNSSTKMLFWSHLQFIYAMNRILLIEHWKKYTKLLHILLMTFMPLQ